MSDLALFLFHTFEVILRGFLIGFSLRMMKALSKESFKLRSPEGSQAIENSVLMGLAGSCFFIGLSILVPKPMQQYWMNSTG